MSSVRFVFTLRVKPPKPSSLHQTSGVQIIVVNSNVRIPDWALDQISGDYPVSIECLRQNHVIIFHTNCWPLHGSALLEIMVHTPSNSRRFFPAEIIFEERVTRNVIFKMFYPVVDSDWQS